MMNFAVRLVVFLAFIVFMGMANACLVVSESIQIIMYVALFMLAIWVFIGYEASN